jgi:integrase
MELNSQILLALLSDKDREELKRVLSVVSEIYLDQFKQEYIEALKPLHSVSYIRSIEYSINQLMKFTGNIPLSKIDFKMVERFILLTYKRSPMAAAHICKTLKASMNKAKLWNYITDNQFEKIKLPKVQVEKPAIISANELELILFQKQESKSENDSQPAAMIEMIPANMKDIYRFAYHTGMRAAEILNLTWKNVNLKDRVIQVGDDKFRTKSGKIRHIPINDNVYQILCSKVSKVIRLDAYVFEKEYGNSRFSRDRKDRKYSVDYISKKFKRACRLAGMNDKIHFHSLRHSCASALVNSGVDLYVVKELLGHSSINVTQIYAHLDMSAMRNAVNVLSVVNAGISLNG